MIIPVNSPTTLLYLIFAFLLLGLGIFIWGKKLPGKGSWLVWGGILALLAGMGFDCGLLLKEDLKIKIWKSGWVGARHELGAITVGVIQDPLALGMTALACLFAALYLLMKQNLVSKDPQVERTYSALAISTAGVALAWTSLTPWLVFVGIFLTILGGFISLGTRWDSDVEAQAAAQFLWERSLGLLLSVFGACILAASRTALFLDQTEIWSNSEHVYSTAVGTALLALGLFIQLQPFPFLGWAVSQTAASPPARTLLNQIFPALASFSIFVRLEPQLRNLGLFPHFGWIALISCLLAVFSGLFQVNWRQSVSTWLVSGFSLACALLAFSGVLPAMALLIGLSLGGMCIAGIGSIFETSPTGHPAHSHRAIALKVAVFLGVCSATGVIGFVSAPAGIHSIMQTLIQPGIAAVFICTFFLFTLLGWKLGWNIIKLQKKSDLSWASIFVFYFWIIFALGVMWTGTFSGGVLIGIPDQVFPSPFQFLFGTQANAFIRSEDFVSASSFYWSAMVLAFLTAYWTVGRKDDQWKRLTLWTPRLSHFLAHGYGIDHAMTRLLRGISWVGKSTETLVDEKIWMNWIPHGISVGIKSTSHLLSELDEKISSILAETLRKAVEVPAKFLQLIQTGDVRWYLFFALGSGFALLAHFLKF